MTGWLPIKSAPRDGTPIVGWCVHAADPYWVSSTRLSIYGGHAEGLAHVVDGPHVLEWGGAWDDEDGSMPDWWFQYGSNFEAAANPTHWLPIPKDPYGQAEPTDNRELPAV